MKVSDCEKHFTPEICSLLDVLWDNIYLIKLLDGIFSPVGYMRDHSNPAYYAEYLIYNEFLALLNNEKPHNLT